MKTRLRLLPRLISTILLGCCIINHSALAAKNSSHQLGPTGIIAQGSKNLFSVQSVDKGSPADGKIKKGDVIVGEVVLAQLRPLGSFNAREVL